MHLLGIVDRPDMDVERAGMGSLDEPAVDECHTSRGDRDLDTSATGMPTTESKTRGPEFRDTLGSQRGAEIGSKHRSNAFDPPVGERPDTHPLNRIKIGEKRNEWFHHSVVFGIDVHPQFRPCSEKLGQQWNRFSSIDERGANFGPCEVFDHSNRVGHAVETVVVERQHIAITGYVCVGFNVAIAQPDGSGERRNRVFWFIASATAMSEGNRTVVIEEGMLRRAHGRIVDALVEVIEPAARFGTLRPVSATDRFIECVNGLADTFVIEEAALLIAAHAHHDLDVEHELSSIAEIARTVTTGDLGSLRAVLFEQFRLGGDRTSYFDPDNSYLDSVLRRRAGIPITLSILTMAVGRRASISLFGAGLPGHFLVGVHDQPGTFLDPFAGGTVLTTEGCRELFHQLHGFGSHFDDLMLAPVDGPAIVERMLNNLLAIFRSEGDIRSQLWVARLRSYLPRATITQRADVALVLANGGQFDAAAEIFETLARSSDNETAAALLGARDRMRSRMN